MKSKEPLKLTLTERLRKSALELGPEIREKLKKQVGLLDGRVKDAQYRPGHAAPAQEDPRAHHDDDEKPSLRGQEPAETAAVAAGDDPGRVPVSHFTDDQTPLDRPGSDPGGREEKGPGQRRTERPDQARRGQTETDDGPEKGRGHQVGPRPRGRLEAFRPFYHCRRRGSRGPNFLAHRPRNGISYGALENEFVSREVADAT